MATAKKADIKIRSTNFTGDDGKLIYPRAHHDHIDGKPTSYPPTTHNHTISEVEGLQDALSDILTKDKIDTALKGSGTESVQLGSDASASGEHSTALGHDTYASGENSIALGVAAYAGGNFSTALGSDAYVEGEGSTGLGYSSSAEGKNSTAVGVSSQASGEHSIALGHDTFASEINSIALGSEAKATGENSIAIGAGTEVTEDYVVDFGSTRQVRVNETPVSDRDAVSKKYLENNSRLNVIDTRTIGSGSSTFDLTPNEIEDKTFKPYFTQVSGAGSSWRSLINVKGWTGNYVSWQLVGPAGTAADDDLYFRSGVGSSWRTPRKIFHSGNLTAGDIPNLPTSKITSGRFTASRLPTDTVYTADLTTKANDNEVVKLSGTQTISGEKTFSSPTTFGYNTGYMLKFGSSSGEVNVRTSSGKLMLQNNGVSSYSPIATEDWVTTTGKAADSGKLNGLDLNSTTTNNEANKVMRTDGSGYANFGWIKTTSGNTNAAVTDVYVNVGDGWIYKKTLPLFKAELGTMPPSTHNHDDRYYTETEMNTLLSAKANDNEVVKLSDEQNISGKKNFQNQVVIENSTQSNPGLTIRGSRANLILETEGITGGAAFSLMKANITNGENKNSTSVATFGAFASGSTTGVPSGRYLFLDARPNAAWNVATLKVDVEDRVGIAIPTTGRPTHTLDVNGKIRMRSQTISSDDDDVVTTKKYVDDKQDKLIAGNNISIVGNTINAIGAGFYELTKPKIETALSENPPLSLGQGAAATGFGATAVGYNSSATKISSTALGRGTTAEGDYSIALGPSANASQNSSTALGPSSTASQNYTTAVGPSSTASGSSSTALGYLSIASGSYSTALGRNTTASQNSSTAVGYLSSAEGSYSTALGYGANTGTASNLIQLGSSSSLGTLRSKVSLTVTSDIRDKADIVEVPKALDFIKDLNPITYVANDRENYISEEQKETDTYKDYLMVEDYDKESHSQGTKKGSRRRVGLSAQEVRDKLIEHYGSDNYANVVNDNFVEFEERDLDIPEGLENKLTMSYETLVPFLIKAIQEQQEQIEELKNKLS